MGLPRLAVALRTRYPWVDALDRGPRSVTAGECDVCRGEARLVAPCGPPPAGVCVPGWAVGRRCVVRLGDGLWCDGHTDEAEDLVGWVAGLPPEADDVARLWWLACGEVRLDPSLQVAARSLGLPAGA